MINLRNLTTNDDIIIYVNTLSADIPYDSDLFLFGFKNGFTNTWTYVMPQIVTQNSRYIRFSIQLVNQASQVDPENGVIQLGPWGNFDYKLWAIETPGLDPFDGYLLDQGQMFLENIVPEIPNIVFISDNDPERNIVYLTRDESDCPTWALVDIWAISNYTWTCGVTPACVTWPMVGDWEDITLAWDDCI
jgi:hypothetical protein